MFAIFDVSYGARERAETYYCPMRRHTAWASLAIFIATNEWEGSGPAMSTLDERPP
jgi:hypothetical protein